MEAFRAKLLVAFVALLLCAGVAPKGLHPVGTHEIAEFLKVEPKRNADQQTEFEKRLAVLLAEKLDAAAASAKLAVEFALTTNVARQLTDLWIQWVLLQENVLFSYDEESRRREVNFKSELHDAFIALVRDSGHARVVLTAAVKALSAYPYECTAGDFSALTLGTSRDTTWRTADEADCSGYWQAMNVREPMNPATLLRMAEYGLQSRPERIAVLEYVRKQIPAGDDHDAVDSYVVRSLIYDYWEAGLVDAGLSLYEALPPDERRQVLEGDHPPIEVSLGGHTLRIPKPLDPSYAVGSPPIDEFPMRGSHEPHEQLAAALLVKGRVEEARATLAASGKFADGAHALIACSLAGESSNCRLDSRSLRFAYLDLLLNHPQDDPYDLFEQSRASMANGWGSSGVWLQVLRKTVETRYQALVELEGKYWDPAEEYPYNTKEREALEATFDPALRARITEVRKMFVDEAHALAAGVGLAGTTERQTVPAPANTHFAERKMPNCTPSTRPGSVKLDEKTFPPGYGPVRAEQNGAEIVAVSLSQNYDPTGEVSPGGYWVHLSHDGGKTWDSPLYTGLADRFPYVVSATSCLPIVAGDHLQIEVKVEELDTASITYPPVAMRSRRQVSGIYLDMPLSELRKDTDGDGLTDIAEENLLLDPNKADSDGDGIADGHDPFPNVPFTGKQGPTHAAIATILDRLFHTESGALIESVDRPAGQILGAWERPVTSPDRPIFLAGEKADFGGFSSKQMILVYSKEELARLNKLKPDFHAIDLGPLILNRAGTRGFISWSAGWTGGMFRVIKDGDTWRAEELTSWIT